MYNDRFVNKAINGELNYVKITFNVHNLCNVAS